MDADFTVKDREPLSSSRAIKILVVDDNPDIVRLIAAFLRGANYEVFVAYNGQAALSALDKGQFDVLLLDLIMPRWSGVDVLKAMRAQGDQTPVIVITAKDLSAAEHGTLKNLAVSAVLVKDDLSRTTLLAHIRQIPVALTSQQIAVDNNNNS